MKRTYDWNEFDWGIAAFAAGVVAGMIVHWIRRQISGAYVDGYYDGQPVDRTIAEGRADLLGMAEQRGEQYGKDERGEGPHEAKATGTSAGGGSAASDTGAARGSAGDPAE